MELITEPTSKENERTKRTKRLLSNGNVVVGDYTSHRLQVFDPQGNFVRRIGVGRLSRPRHLFVDSDDNILVSDFGNNAIQVFKSNGTPLKAIPTGQPSGPAGVCMDRDGRIIVSEVDSPRVSVI